MMFLYPKEDTLKILCWYLNWKCVRKVGSRRGVLGGRLGFLTRDMEDRVIPDVMNNVFLPQGRYPENFVLISQLEVCQEGGVVKKGDTWRMLRVPDHRHGEQGYSSRHEWCFFTPRKIPWKFCVDISIRRVSGIGVKKGDTWRMLMVPDQKLRGKHYLRCLGWWCFIFRKIC